MTSEKKDFPAFYITFFILMHADVYLQFLIFIINLIIKMFHNVKKLWGCFFLAIKLIKKRWQTYGCHNTFRVSPNGHLDKHLFIK